MMSQVTSSPLVLIVEPDESLMQPYAFLPSFYQITRVTTTEIAQQKIVEQLPHLVLLSSNLAQTKQLTFLEKLKEVSVSELPALVLVIDWPKPSWVPSTTWGGRIGLSHSVTNQQELFVTLERLSMPTTA